MTRREYWLAAAKAQREAADTFLRIFEPDLALHHMLLADEAERQAAEAETKTEP